MAGTAPGGAPLGRQTGRAAKILFVNLGEDWIRGQEQVLLDLACSLDRTRFEPVVWSNAPTLARACRDLGITAEHSRFGYFLANPGDRLDVRRYLSYIGAAREMIRRHAIDLIHCNGAAPLQFCVPAARLTGRPVLGHLHFDENRRSRFAFLTHMADLVVGVSRQTASGVLADGMDPRRVRVVHNGIDFAKLEQGAERAGALRSQLGIPEDAVVIASVGSLIPRKGHDVLLRAMVRLATEQPSAHLIIAGGGPEEKALHEQVAQLGLDRRVHLLGEVSRPGHVYRASDIFALASYSEALPLVFLEAAHFGLPSVATAVGGVPEAVQDGRTGLLVPPGDDAALAAALLQFSRDAERRRAFGATARQQAQEGYSVGAMVAAFEALFTGLTDRDWRASVSSGAARLRPYLRLLRGAAS